MIIVDYANVNIISIHSTACKGGGIYGRKGKTFRQSWIELNSAREAAAKSFA